jgi:hypothetical protein
LTSVGNVLTWTDSGLTNGSTYWYQVAAVNAADAGPRSNEVSATPSDTEMTMPVVVPRFSSPGVPLSAPVDVLNVAQDGMLVMRNESVLPSASVARGVKD